MGKDKCLNAAGKYLLAKTLMEHYLRECRKSLLHRKYEKKSWSWSIDLSQAIFSVSEYMCQLEKYFVFVLQTSQWTIIIQLHGCYPHPFAQLPNGKETFHTTVSRYWHSCNETVVILVEYFYLLANRHFVTILNFHSLSFSRALWI